MPYQLTRGYSALCIPALQRRNWGILPVSLRAYLLLQHHGEGKGSSSIHAKSRDVSLAFMRYTYSPCHSLSLPSGISYKTYEMLQ